MTKTNSKINNVKFMRFPENQTNTSNKNKVSSVKSVSDDMNYQELSQSDNIKYIRKNNVLPTINVFNFLIRGAFSLIILAFLFVAAIYYGIINP
jgi:hypothetical protein